MGIYIVIAIFIIIFGLLAYLIVYTVKFDIKRKKLSKLEEKKKEEESELFWKKFYEDQEQREKEEEEKLASLIDKYDAIFGQENSFECCVQGVFARSKQARDEASLLKKGDLVNLKNQPSNMYDEYAVKVLSNGKHIGYIPVDYSERVFKVLSNKKGKYISFVTYQKTSYDSYYDKDETTLFIKLYISVFEDNTDEIDDKMKESKPQLTPEEIINNLEKKYPQLKHLNFEELEILRKKQLRNINSLEKEIQKGDKPDLLKIRRKNIRLKKEEIRLILHYLSNY